MDRAISAAKKDEQKVEDELAAVDAEGELNADEEASDVGGGTTGDSRYSDGAGQVVRLLRPSFLAYYQTRGG